MVPVQTLLDAKSFLLGKSAECTKEDVESNAKLIRDIFAGYKHMAKALRKGMGDMGSALNCVKTSTQLQSSQKKRAAREKRQSLKLPPHCSTSDPSCLKIYKALETLG